jgi:hypothetical protein
MAQHRRDPGRVDAEFNDDARRTLITQILRAFKEFEDNNPNTPLDPLNPAAWSCLWLSDMEKLERILEGAKSDPVDKCLALNGLASNHRWLSSLSFSPVTVNYCHPNCACSSADWILTPTD